MINSVEAPNHFKIILFFVSFLEGLYNQRIAFSDELSGTTSFLNALHKTQNSDHPLPIMGNATFGFRTQPKKISGLLATS